MDLLTNIGIVFLAGLIHANFQLSLGCLLLLFRRSLGSTKLRHKSSSLSGSFIAGVGTITGLLIFSLNFLLNNLFNSKLPAYITLIEVGVLTSLAFIILLIYYRRGRGTKLWLPSQITSFLEARAGKTTNDTEAFSLGIMSIFCELPLSLILIIIASSNIIVLPPAWQILVSAMYILILIAPVFVANLLLKKSSNISRLQKWRESNKLFTRLVLSFGFIVIGIYILACNILPSAEGLL